MEVLNIHKRKFKKPIFDILEFLPTLSTKSDRIWPIENWPPIKFKNGLKIGSNGGHAMIKYEIIDYHPQSHIEFKFQKPTGFNGTHKFEIYKLNSESFEIKHTLVMITSGMGTLSWLLAIRWLHDAILEDAFDKVENQLTKSTIKTDWNLWVKALRWLLKPKK
jgi:hypothetical protein